VLQVRKEVVPRVIAEALGRDDMREALGNRGLAAVFRILGRCGITQRQMAALTKQTQSEISEILNGRRVVAYDVLVRIADGLGVPRGYMGLAYCVSEACSGGAEGNGAEDSGLPALDTADGVADAEQGQDEAAAAARPSEPGDVAIPERVGEKPDAGLPQPSSCPEPPRVIRGDEPKEAGDDGLLELNGA
jgi:transcriptional regulator with XRE-family HTH domain